MAFFVHRIKLRDDALRAVEAWTAEVNRRKSEFEATMRDEGVTLEVWSLQEDEDGLFLTSLMETDDLERALAVYKNSSHAIDAYHRKFIEQYRVSATSSRVLFVCQPE